MKEFLYSFLDSSAKKLIETKHCIQKNKYGVYEPPGLKQLISLRHLLISIGILREIEPELLTCLTKTECNELLKKLSKIYNLGLRNSNLKNNTIESFALSENESNYLLKN